MTFLYLFTIIISGILLSYILVKTSSFLIRTSLGIGLGILLYSSEYFLILKLGLKLDLKSVLFSIFTTVILLFLLNIKNKSIVKDIKNIKLINIKNFFNGERKYFLFVLLSIGTLITLITVFWPISEWDALTLYDFRGRLYADEFTFRDVQKLDNLDTFNAGYYFSYPPSTSLIHASFYILGSNTPQIIYPLIFFSLIAYFYKSIAKHTTSDVAILFSGVLMLTNIFVNHASVPYTNLPYTYFYFVSTISLVEYMVLKRDFKKIVLSSIFLAGASWMRSVEPFYLVNLLIFLIYVVLQKKDFLKLIILSIPVILVKSFWSNTQSEYATVSFLNNVDYSSIISNLEMTIPTVISKALLSYKGFIMSNGLLFTILILSTVLYFVSKNKNRSLFKKWLLLIVYLNLGVILVGTIAIGILIPGRIEIYDSIGRFGIFLYPLIIFLSGLGVNKILGYKKTI